jgi:hypothetical protein
VKRTLAIWLILATSAVAQTTPRPLRYCYIEATNVSNSDELRSHWESVWGSYDREHLHRMALKIRVGTTEDTGGRVTLNWFWLGRQQVDNALIIYGGGTKEVTIPRAYFTELYALAPQIRRAIKILCWPAHITSPALSMKDGLYRCAIPIIICSRPKLRPNRCCSSFAIRRSSVNCYFRQKRAVVCARGKLSIFRVKTDRLALLISESVFSSVPLLRPRLATHANSVEV